MPEVVRPRRLADPLYRESRGEAEMRAARKLGVSPMAVVLASRRLWGRSLTAEREARVAARIAPR